jgi:hypothetical protein
VERTLPARRLVAVAASGFLGVAGALALATPASAQPPVLDSTLDCDEVTGQYVITWTVTNRVDFPGTLTGVAFEPAPDPALSPGIVTGAPLPAADGGPLQAEHRVPGDTVTASLAVTLTWTDGDQPRSAAASRELTLAGDCVRAPGSDVSDLDATAFWEFDCEVFTFWVVNDSDVELELRLEPSVGDPETLAVPAGGESDRVELTASEGLLVEVFLDDDEEPVTFEDEDGNQQSPRITSELWQDLGCEDDEDGGAGGELPATGIPAGLMTATGFALLALGGTLLLVAPRRRATSPA